MSTTKNDHDDGEKTFLGQRGRFNGDDIMDIVVRQPATARFIARHLYNFFVADEPHVPAWPHTAPRDGAAVNILADAYLQSGYDMRSVMRTLFNSDFFKDESVRYAKVKSPIEVVVGTLRLVEDYIEPKPGIDALVVQAGYMGQMILNPPASKAGTLARSGSTAVPSPAASTSSPSASATPPCPAYRTSSTASPPRAECPPPTSSTGAWSSWAPSPSVTRPAPP